MPARPALTALPFRRPLWHLALVLLLAALALAARPAAAQVLRFQEALTVRGDGASFPGTTDARSVPLPDDWAQTSPGYSGVRWYRMAFDAPGARERGEMMALYIERACSTVQVLLNGRVLHPGGQLREPVSRNCYRPQLVPLPAGLIEPHGNVLDLKVVGFALETVASRQRSGGLSVVELGPYDLLADRFDWRTASAITLPQVMSGSLLLLGGFMCLMGWFNRGNSHLAYYGALLVGWSVMGTRVWLAELPWANAVSEFLYATLISVLTLAGIQFLMRYGGRRERWLDMALVAQCALMPLTLMAAGPSRLYAFTTFWFGIMAVEAAAAVLFYLRDKQRQGNRRQFWLMLPLLTVSLACVFVLLAGQRNHLEPALFDGANLLLALLFMALGMRLVQQFGYALQAAQDDRENMEQRIREITAQLERSFTQMADQRVEQVTERERKRIAADLHDDLGAKLLTIVHTSDDPRISTLAREALEEMRLSVRGLTGKPVKLLDALGDWRAEVVNRLSQAGVEGEWHAPAEELPQTLTARAYVQTTRILREAVSNIIKHSGATRCTVRCAIRDGDFQLVIQDNGHGIPMELDGKLDRGHGMSTMKHRAKQMQGQCLVESGPGYGTVIRLTLPLDVHATAS